MKQSRIDFIKEAHESACSSWKARIEKEFPKIFKDEFKVGDWVIYNLFPDSMVCRIESCLFDQFLLSMPHGKVCSHNARFPHWRASKYYISRKATKEEIESHLIAEAKRRGFVKGVKATRKHMGDLWSEVVVEGKFKYGGAFDELTDGLSQDIIYQKGQWAEIIEQPPKDIQELLEKYGKEELKKYL